MRALPRFFTHSRPFILHLLRRASRPSVRLVQRFCARNYQLLHSLTGLPDRRSRMDAQHFSQWLEHRRQGEFGALEQHGSRSAIILNLTRATHIGAFYAVEDGRRDREAWINASHSFTVTCSAIHHLITLRLASDYRFPCGYTLLTKVLVLYLINRSHSSSRKQTSTP